MICDLAGNWHIPRNLTETKRFKTDQKRIKQGELIGEIRILQRILKYPQSFQAELPANPLKELQTNIFNYNAIIS